MLLDKEFLIKGRQLLKLFRFCPSCGSNMFDTAQFVTLTASGTNPIISREQPEEVASYDIKCYPSELLSTKEDCHDQEDHLDLHCS
ncbi:hypothetical protein COOONC_06063 [Cooperia oncophora]